MTTDQKLVRITNDINGEKYWIKSCHYCGSINLEVSTIGGDDYQVTCEGCYATGPVTVSPFEAIKMWNRASATMYLGVGKGGI